MIHITVDCDDDFFIQNKVYYKGKFETFEDLMEFMQENVKSKQKKVRAYDYLLDCKTHRDTGYDQNDNKTQGCANLNPQRATEKRRICIRVGKER